MEMFYETLLEDMDLFTAQTFSNEKVCGTLSSEGSTDNVF